MYTMYLQRLIYAIHVTSIIIIYCVGFVRDSSLLLLLFYRGNSYSGPSYDKFDLIFSCIAAAIIRFIVVSYWRAIYAIIRNYIGSANEVNNRCRILLLLLYV